MRVVEGCEGLTGDGEDWNIVYPRATAVVLLRCNPPPPIITGSRATSALSPKGRTEPEAWGAIG